MFALLLTILLACLVIGGVLTMILVLFGLGVIATFTLKILMALGLVYLGIKLLTKIF